MPTVFSSEPPNQRRQAALLTALAALLYLALAAWLVTEILSFNHGRFTYALDDPYIHLALSNNIAHGHYGINAGEFASPSSSLLWPFLLAPFASLRAETFVPLALNILASLAVTALIGAAVARWPQPNGAVSPRAESFRRGLSAVALVFVANLLGLTFTGMEHVLQILLSGAGAWGIVACLRGRQIPFWVLLAVALGPSVRYENVGIALAVAIALIGQRRRRTAAAMLIAALAPLLLFSLFLHHLGLPWLPTSVIVKSRVRGAGSVEAHGLLLILGNLQETLADPQRLLVLILFAALAGLAWRQRDRVRRFALTGAATAAGLHLAIGRYDWFHRYEVYIVFFSALVLLHMVHETGRVPLSWYTLGLLGCSYAYIQAFHEVPFSANQVFRQQFQTHRFVDDFYEGNVAVNDLGLVSYHLRPSAYVLDLWGLASVEAAEQKHRSTAWMDATTKEHHVGLVAIYPLWFPPPPADWTLLGELCENDPPVALGNQCVVYYATPEASLPDLQDDFSRFVATLPFGITVRLPNLPPIYH